ncbi:transmembrane signal receptor [Lithospermum erythrorhizon]|uniref:Transmembrane signal receptor n=1 Tax=Lithospermum erythrorhizon TaxID=34254 RepID=A0AAV3PJ87_LITER
MANVNEVKEPLTYKEAKQHSKWLLAIEKEIQALELNNTWEIVDLPPGHKPIAYKWVYKIKSKPDGSIDKYKARLVVKGYNQIEDLDYFDSFSLVAKLVTVRLVLAIATSKGWLLHQMNINNAFFHDFLNEEIYMSLPEGYR